MASSKAIVVRLELCLDGLLEEYFRQYFFSISVLVYSVLCTVLFLTVLTVFLEVKLEEYFF